MPYCGACGTAQSATARFCGSCGAPQSQPLVPSQPVAPRPAPPAPATVLAAPASATVLPSPPPAGRMTAPAFDARAVGDAARSLVGEFGKLPVSTLVPWRIWMNERVWQQSWALLFLVAAAAPFLLLHLGTDPSQFGKVSWGFSLYFAFIWFIALHTLIRPGQLAWQLIGKVAVFTAVAGVAIAIGIEKHLAGGDMNVFKYVVGVGVPEELAKALAVYLFLFRSRSFHSLRTFVFIGAVSGLAFGAAEAVSYSTAYASVLPFLSSATGSTTLIVVEIWRLLTDSLFHACMAGVSAFFIGLAYHYRSHQVSLIGFGLAFAGVLHGLYDNFANGWVGTLLAILIVLVFVCYVQTGDRIGQAFAAHTAAPAPVPASPAGWDSRAWASPPAPPTGQPAAAPPSVSSAPPLLDPGLGPQA